MAINTVVGARIRELRESKGLSQTHVAKLRHITQPTVAKQEQGLRALGEEGLMWYADYFNVSTDYLLGRTESPDLHKHVWTDPSGREIVGLSKRKEAPTQAEVLDYAKIIDRAIVAGPEGRSESFSDAVRRIVDARIQELLKRPED